MYVSNIRNPEVVSQLSFQKKKKLNNYNFAPKNLKSALYISHI